NSMFVWPQSPVPEGYLKRGWGWNDSTDYIAAIKPLENDGTFAVRVKFGESLEEDMMVDTGSSRTFIPARIVEALKLQVGKREMAARGVAGVMPYYTVILPKLSIGGANVTN